MSIIKESTISHVIFDLGGTLVDLKALELVLGEYARSIGKNLPQSFYVVLKEGEAKQLIGQLLELLDMEDPEEVKKIILNKIMSTKYELIAGADKLVRHLYENNIPMAIASNASKPMVMKQIENTNGWDFKYFSHVCGTDDPEVKNNKPAPDVYLACAKQFKSPPKSFDNCVIFEDSLVGIEGAVASGMRSVFITERNLSEFESITDKVTLIVDSLANFKPEDIGLPPYKTE